MPRYLFVQHHKPNTESASKDDIKRINSPFYFESTIWTEMGNKMIMRSFVMTGMNSRLVPLPRGLAKAEGQGGRGQLHAA
jgi:hypothetical protein